MDRKAPEEGGISPFKVDCKCGFKSSVSEKCLNCMITKGGLKD